jgi:hypothetical protein
VNVIEIDERVFAWEEPASHFVVYLYSRAPRGGRLRSYEASHCTLIEAARWAQKTANPDEAYSIGVVASAEHTSGIRWLLGSDPNSLASDELSQTLAEWHTEQRDLRF